VEKSLRKKLSTQILSHGAVLMSPLGEIFVYRDEKKRNKEGEHP